MLHTMYVHTDGACSPNPGVGGWAAVFSFKHKDRWSYSLSGAQYKTTNNEMELRAVFEAMNLISTMKWGPVVRIVTDSKYVVSGFDNIFKWGNNGWMTNQNTPVKNAHLWNQIHQLLSHFPVKVEWCKGHSGNVLNGVADKLAVQARVDFAAHLDSLVNDGLILDNPNPPSKEEQTFDKPKTIGELLKAMSPSALGASQEVADSVAKKILDGWSSNPSSGVDLASGKDQSFSLHCKGGKILTHKGNFDMGDI